MNTLASFTATDTLWMLVCACFVFFMQAGFTCYEAGLVQSKNVISVAIENIFNLTISIVLFSLVGFPMMFGETIFSADSSAETAFVFLQIMFAAVSVTIFAGALSERTKLAPAACRRCRQRRLDLSSLWQIGLGAVISAETPPAGKTGIPRLCRSQRSTYDCRFCRTGRTAGRGKPQQAAHR